MSAICIFCGTRKANSKASCVSCGKKPQGMEQDALSQVLTSEAINEKGLEFVVGMIQAGKDPLGIAQIKQRYDTVLEGMVMASKGGMVHDEHVDASKNTEAISSSPEREPCPYCGELIVIDSKKCRFCMEWLVERGNQHGARQESKSSSGGGLLHIYERILRSVTGSATISTGKGLSSSENLMPYTVMIGLRMLYASYAIVLIYLSFSLPKLLAECSRAARQNEMPVPVAYVIAATTLLAIITPFIFVIYKLSRGANWARILYAIMIFIGLVNMIFGDNSMRINLMHTILNVIVTMLQIAATACMFMPAANLWFSSHTLISKKLKEEAPSSAQSPIPYNVKMGLGLLYISCAFGVIYFMLALQDSQLPREVQQRLANNPELAQHFYFSMLTSIPIAILIVCFLASKMSRRANWARISFAVLCFAETLSMIFSGLPMHDDPMQTILKMIMTVILIAATVCMFTPSANVWFSQKESEPVFAAQIEPENQCPK